MFFGFFKSILLVFCTELSIPDNVGASQIGGGLALQEISLASRTFEIVRHSNQQSNSSCFLWMDLKCFCKIASKRPDILHSH